MASQAGFGKISETEFSSLLQALSSTSKGRAFLDEYRRRTQPEDTYNLLDTMQRLEKSMAVVREHLRPDRIANELRDVAMALDIAVAGTDADPDGDENARRFALAAQARQELQTLASTLAPDMAEIMRQEEEHAGVARDGSGYKLRESAPDR